MQLPQEHVRAEGQSATMVCLNLSAGGRPSARPMTPCPRRLLVSVTMNGMEAGDDVIICCQIVTHAMSHATGGAERSGWSI